MIARTTRRSVVGGLLSSSAMAAGALVLQPAGGFAQGRPVRVVVPFAPGGGADLMARLLQPHLQQRLGQSFYVENRAGAAGRIGTDAVAKAEGDGQTLLITTESSIVIAPHIGVAMSYDPLRDFAPISLLTRNVVILVVHPTVPANTLQEYIALARAKPGEMFYASSGVGGPNHLAGEIFKQMAGVDITHVPFPGTGAAIPAVISNQVGAMWGFLAGLIPHIRGGLLKVLAVGGRERSPVLPDVQTVAEAGVPGYEAASWIGLLAPTATPRPLIDRLQEGVHAAIQVPAVRDLLLRDGSDIVASTPEAFRQLSPVVRWAVLGNVGTLMVFRVSAEDAELLAPEFDPLPAHELLDQPRYRAWLRRAEHGYRVAFIEPPLFQPRNTKARVIAQSRRNFGRQRELIE